MHPATKLGFSSRWLSHATSRKWRCLLDETKEWDNKKEPDGTSLIDPTSCNSCQGQNTLHNLAGTPNRPAVVHCQAQALARHDSSTVHVWTGCSRKCSSPGGEEAGNVWCAQGLLLSWRIPAQDHLSMCKRYVYGLCQILSFQSRHPPHPKRRTPASSCGPMLMPAVRPQGFPCLSGQHLRLELDSLAVCILPAIKF